MNHRHVLSRLIHVVLLSLLFSVVVPATMGQANVKGQWSTLSYLMPINPVHAALLSNGKVLIVAGSGNCPPSQSGCPAGAPYGPANSSGAALWDPATGNITQFTLSWDMFCNGMVLLQDGRALIDSGTIQYDPFYGQPQVAVFDPATNTFTNVQSMAHGRWYPTVLTLGDGRVMAFSGLNETSATNTAVEFYTAGSGWSQQYPASWTPDLYPRLHLLPNGTVFYSGAQTTSKLFDPSTTTWNTNVATTIYGNFRTYGTSVLLPLTPGNNYDPQVVIMGGHSPATNTSEIIDMGAPTPAWQAGPNMSAGRIEMNAVILPDGRVLAVGGSVNDEDTSTASLNADLLGPDTSHPGQYIFSSAGANAYARLYHSVALLLPDATVWLAGGNPSRGTYVPQMEIYQPPYLFNSTGGLATRPSITGAPSSISYGNPFTVQTPDAASIAHAILVRNGTVTHAFGMDQREVEMSFTAGSGTLTVTAPPNGNIAPPGFYMLFVLNSSGVPSVARFVQVVASAPPPPGIAFVQGGSGPSTLQASNSSVAVAYASAQVAGDLNVVVVGWGDTTSSISSVTDSHGITYTLAAGPTSNTGLQQSIYYAKNIAAGSNTVTVKFNQAASYPDVRILEYSGLDASNPLDGKASAAGSGTTANSGAATTSSANELIFGAGTTGAQFSAAGSGFANRMINIYGNIAEDKTVTSTGNYSATATTSSSVWVMQVVTFRGSGQAAGPTVTAISPTSGTTAGGTAVTITGTGFLAGATVTLGGTAATNVNVVSGTSITATTPAHTAGAVSVVVTNSGGQSGSLNNGYTYTSSNPAPTVSTISPVTGPAAGGTAVTITGTGFLSGAGVTLGGTAATNVVVVSATSITAKTPAHAGGAVNVAVTNTDGQSGSLSNGFTYTNPAPTVTAISPVSGTTAGGTAVTITGTGFLAGASVTLGGTAATNVTVVSGISITATTPAHTAGAVNVVVTNTDGQSSTLSSGYTYSSASGGGISFVQGSSGPSTLQASNSSVAVAYPSAEVAGHLNVVVVGWGDTTSSISSVTDNRGNTYTLAAGPTTNTGLQQSIYYAKNIAGGSTTVTVKFNKAASYPDVRILEYSGANTSSPLDGKAAAAGSGTTANSGAVTTTSANELIFGAGTTGTQFSAAGSGFVNRMINVYGNIAEDKTVTSTGSYNATATTGSSVWVMQVVTFK
jgi:hypothetical protein